MARLFEIGMQIAIHVLIIDDEPLILRALTKALVIVGSHIVVTALTDADKCIEIINTQSIEIVLCGVGMSSRVTQETLICFQQHSPATIRCILKGTSFDDLPWQADEMAHFCLAKPFTYTQLRHVMQCTQRLLNLAIAPELKNLLGKMKGLPVIRQQVIQITNALLQKPVNFEVLIGLISHEPLLSSKLIQAANSALLGFASETTNLQQALIRVGTSLCRALVVNSEVRSHYQKILSNKLLATISDHAFARATQAKVFAKKAHLSSQSQDIVFLLGLLSGVGSMALYVLVKELNEGEQTLLSEELISVYILNLWGFSEQITQVMLLPKTLSQITDPIIAIHFLAREVVQTPEFELTEGDIQALENLDLVVLIQELVTI